MFVHLHWVMGRQLVWLCAMWRVRHAACPALAVSICKVSTPQRVPGLPAASEGVNAPCHHRIRPSLPFHCSETVSLDPVQVD